VVARLPHVLLVLTLQEGIFYLGSPFVFGVSYNVLTGEVPANLSSTSILSQWGSRATYPHVFYPSVLLDVSPPPPPWCLKEHLSRSACQIGQCVSVLGNRCRTYGTDRHLHRLVWKPGRHAGPGRCVGRQAWEG
jgi:hypothetical protein